MPPPGGELRLHRGQVATARSLHPLGLNPLVRGQVATDRRALSLGLVRLGRGQVATARRDLTLADRCRRCRIQQMQDRRSIFGSVCISNSGRLQR